MKHLVLSSCLAVAASAAAADLKDPSQVTADWNKTIGDARQPVLAAGPLGLTAGGPGVITFDPGLARPPPRRRLNGDVLEVPPGPGNDSRMLKAVPGEMPPLGAKPWYYRGQKFWIVPIAEEGK
ncbi:MAG: hypothetical protein JWQ83_21 [Lacunisphaera sp.]|jgi:hypothetical protein|nr:hypothetical protein [Lacunisphaera sp.]